MTTNCCANDIFGADPINIKWNVVRGDSSSLRIEFFENNEATAFDTSDWIYFATAYDFKTDILDVLEVVPGTGYVDIKATPDVTSNWGSGYGRTTAELAFDLQITLPDDVTVWTPVVGTISVIADVTGAL